MLQLVPVRKVLQQNVLGAKRDEEMDSEIDLNTNADAQ